MTEQKRKEIYRLGKKGKIAGVCAGIADYFGWETWLVRIIAVSALLLGSGFVFVAYIAAWLILDKKEDHIKDNAKEYAHFGGEFSEPKTADTIKVKARIWQQGEPPKQAFYDIKRKLTQLEQQLIEMERYVTSSEFTLSREINKL